MQHEEAAAERRRIAEEERKKKEAKPAFIPGIKYRVETLKKNQSIYNPFTKRTVGGPAIGTQYGYIQVSMIATKQDLEELLSEQFQVQLHMTSGKNKVELCHKYWFQNYQRMDNFRQDITRGGIQPAHPEIRKLSLTCFSRGNLLKPFLAIYERERTIVAGIHDALMWKHVLEAAGEKRFAPRTVIYPAEAKGLKRVLAPGDVRLDQREEFWEAYSLIFEERES
jgi:hypothetical protein